MNSIVRVGQGYDIHRLQAHRRLVLAGVEIPFEKGLLGHSDADVVIHALIDALLGAAGLGDIGEHFPDTDSAYKDIDSAVLLKEALQKVRTAGFKPANVDTTIIAEQPKLSPYKTAMRENLARLIGLESQAVSVKAKTNEGIDETGAARAIACQALVSLTTNG